MENIAYYLSESQFIVCKLKTLNPVVMEQHKTT